MTAKAYCAVQYACISVRPVPFSNLAPSIPLSRKLHLAISQQGYVYVV